MTKSSLESAYPYICFRTEYGLCDSVKVQSISVLVTIGINKKDYQEIFEVEERIREDKES